MGSAWKDLCGWSCVGAWYTIEESKMHWSDKHSRPWLVIVDTGSGPIVQAVPRSSTKGRSSRDIRQEPHHHASEDPDQKTCRIRKKGWVVRDRRRVRREWIEDPRSFCCYEPDSAVLEAVRCWR